MAHGQDSAAGGEDTTQQQRTVADVSGRLTAVMTIPYLSLRRRCCQSEFACSPVILSSRSPDSVLATLLAFYWTRLESTSCTALQEDQFAFNCRLKSGSMYAIRATRVASRL